MGSKDFVRVNIGRGDASRVTLTREELAIQILSNEELLELVRNQRTVIRNANQLVGLLIVILCIILFYLFTKY